MQCQAKFLSTLSLRRATVHYDNYNLHCVISIHALLAESDVAIMLYDTSSLIFLSTLSLRRATTWARGSRATYIISIHALLAESDNTPIKAYNIIKGFLSTLSLRRATWTARSRRPRNSYFYPRSPCGERPGLERQDDRPDPISIHALLAESDSSH